MQGAISHTLKPAASAAKIPPSIVANNSTPAHPFLPAGAPDPVGALDVAAPPLAADGAGLFEADCDDGVAVVDAVDDCDAGAADDVV